MNAELWAQNSSNSISTNSYDIKIVYHDWDRAGKRSDDIFGSVLSYKRHELDSCSTDYPVWLLLLPKGSERLWLVLRIQASRHQIPHGLPAHEPVLAFCIETPYNEDEDPYDLYFLSDQGRRRHRLVGARGLPRENIIEPQLGYALRHIINNLQEGQGCGHGLVGILEIDKTGS